MNRFFVRILSDMHNVTFKPIVISSNRRKDGTYPVKIRVTFKGVSRRLATTLVAYPKDLTRSLKIKNPDILNKANELIARMQGAISDLSFVIEEWEVDRVVEYIKKQMAGDDFRLDFFQFAEAYIKGKSASTAHTYVTALQAFRRFIGDEIDINDMTRALMQGFAEFIENEPRIHRGKESKVKKRAGASTRYLGKLEHIFNQAKAQYNDDEKILIPRSPFDFPKIKQTHHGQRALPVETIRLMLTETDPALCAFLVSFCLMGANMADLYLAKPCEDVWVYHRQKTKDRRQDGAELRVRIPEEVKPYLERLQDGPKGWMLPALHKMVTKDQCTDKVNKALKRWAKAKGVEEFTFYSARKAWATIARKVGVEKATIDECLAHKGDYQMADIYIERQWELLDKANERVLRYTFGDSAI